MDIRIIITGGTLDKLHDTLSESLIFSSDGCTHMPELLKIGRCHYPVQQTVLMKDSLEMDDTDRQRILDTVLSAPEDHIVITHGTGTMEQTAQLLAAHISGKTVILTGAMRPFSLGKSDAGFNVGGALIAAQTLPSGVWGVMNGRVFAASDLHKNTQEGRFDL